jgi:hypothetical protein
MYDEGGGGGCDNDEGGGVCLVSNDELGVVLGGGANSYDAGPVSLPFRDDIEGGGGPLDRAIEELTLIDVSSFSKKQHTSSCSTQ